MQGEDSLPSAINHREINKRKQVSGHKFLSPPTAHSLEEHESTSYFNLECRV